MDLHCFIRRSRESQSLIDVRQAMLFAVSLSEALSFLHSGCVIHRDLKPSNILLQQRETLQHCAGGVARRCWGFWE
jgi:serine/threonine protein kinase